MANPKKSAYAFALDRKARNAGQFIVGFRANGNSEIVTWVSSFTSRSSAVLILRDLAADQGRSGCFLPPQRRSRRCNESRSYSLSLARILSLTTAQQCNAFKMAYQAQLAKVSSQMPAPQLSSRTPLHQFSSRTPNPSGMGYTPQTGMSSQGGRTPGRPTPSGMTPVGALSAALRFVLPFPRRMRGADSVCSQCRRCESLRSRQNAAVRSRNDSTTRRSIGNDTRLRRRIRIRSEPRSSFAGLRINVPTERRLRLDLPT